MRYNEKIDGAAVSLIFSYPIVCFSTSLLTKGEREGAKSNENQTVIRQRFTDLPYILYARET